MASTINEAKEMAANDLRCRMHLLRDDDFVPVCYKVWARGAEGEYSLAATIEAS